MLQFQVANIRLQVCIFRSTVIESVIASYSPRPKENISIPTERACVNRSLAEDFAKSDNVDSITRVTLYKLIENLLPLHNDRA